MGTNNSGHSQSDPGRSVDVNRAVAMVSLAVILILAVAIRLYGLNWDNGFAWTPHPDERAILSKVAIIHPPNLKNIDVLFDVEASPWNPRWFPYGSFPLYALKGVELLIELFSGFELTDLRQTGRIVSSLADLVTVGMAFLLGSMVFSRKVGLIAAGLLTFAVLHIQLSHFFAVDTFLALSTVLTMFFLVRVAKYGRKTDSILAGTFLGFGLATKVSLAPIVGAYVFVHLLYASGLLSSPRRNSLLISERVTGALNNGVVGCLMAVFVFFVVQPYAFLDWGRFYADITEQAEMVRRIRDYPYTRQYVDTTPYLYQIKQLITWGLGWPVGILSVGAVVYAGFRGLKFTLGIIYFIFGCLLPILVLSVSNGVLGVFVSTVIAICALMLSMPFRRADTRVETILLSWVLPYFFIIGSFEVKFLRYLIPITPFLLLFAARLIVGLLNCDIPFTRVVIRRTLRAAIMLIVIMTLASTVFYAVAFVGIYTEKHTAVQASEWINSNVPENSVILKEHWEEGLPNLTDYQNYELPVYEPDTVNKLTRIGTELSRADYLVLFSNRLYGTIPRLPDRYPVTRAYYTLLFKGHLGFRLDAHFESYPTLFRTTFVDDTFSRPGLRPPEPLASFNPSPISLNMGFADESFSVYDHPKVLIFKNVSKFSSEAISSKILDASAGFPKTATNPGKQFENNGLMLSNEDVEIQQSGGTWSDIVENDNRKNWMHVLAWILVVEGIAILSFPLAFLVFRQLPDGGWVFSKALGLLFVGLIVWTCASFRWIRFSQDSVQVAVLGLFIVSFLVLLKQRTAIKEFIAKNWKVLTIGEMIFVLAFITFLIIRMANPDLWHPYRGGEKPMDMAYLNAVMKSTYMPPYDPWFSGGQLNYYYWGQFLIATLIHATGIAPDIAINLAIAMFFALTFSIGYSLVYNLAESTKRRLSLKAGSFIFSPVIGGLCAGFFIVVLGNLDGAIQLGEGVYRTLIQGVPFGEFDFWRSSRMMPPDPPGHEITEFPFFTFLFADPHAHMMALPFTLLALAASLSVLHVRGTRGNWTIIGVFRLGVLGVVVGSLRVLNTWDYPTYLLIAMGSVVIGEFLSHGGLNLSVAARCVVKIIIVFLAGYIAFAPYVFTYETFFNSVEATTNTTEIWQFLSISGVFVFIIASYYLLELRALLRQLWHRIRFVVVAMTATVAGEFDRQQNEHVFGPVSAKWGVLIISSLLATAYLVTAVFTVSGYSTIIFAGLMALMIGAVAVRCLAWTRPDSSNIAFISLLILTAFLLALTLDLVRVEGDIDRMNTVFKFYLQVWVLMAVGSSYLLWRIFNLFPDKKRIIANRRVVILSRVWIGGLMVLLICASVYPLLGTKDRLRDRFDGNVTPLTLNGTAFIDGTTFRDPEGDIDLELDFEGIRWIRENIVGSPVLLEANTPSYRWGGRVSVYTGLPSVVGWKWHQEQQRWGYRNTVDRRIKDVQNIYSTIDVNEAIRLLEQYNVRYIYIGQLERVYYPVDGISKFSGSMSPYVESVFSTNYVTIYKVKHDAF